MSSPSTIDNNICNLDRDVKSGGLFLSVVVCTLNRHEDLLRTLKYFAVEETYIPFEVIVIDQSDEVNPLVQALLEKHSDRFQAIHRSEKHLAKARNAAIQIAKGEIIVFVDDDVDILPGFLAAHAAAFVDAETWGSTGPVFDSENRKLVSAQSLTQLDIDDLETGRNVMHTDFAYNICTLAGGNMAIRRSVFDKIGNFDEFYENYADDVEISHRIKLAGGRLRYIPVAQLVHYARQTGGVRTNPVSHIRSSVRSIVFFDQQSTLRQVSILRMFRALCRSNYRSGRIGFLEMLAFWQGVGDARREFNHRVKRKTLGTTKT